MKNLKELFNNRIHIKAYHRYIRSFSFIDTMIIESYILPEKAKKIIEEVKPDLTRYFYKQNKNIKDFYIENLPYTYLESEQK